MSWHARVPTALIQEMEGVIQCPQTNTEYITESSVIKVSNFCCFMQHSTQISKSQQSVTEYDTVCLKHSTRLYFSVAAQLQDIGNVAVLMLFLDKEQCHCEEKLMKLNSQKLLVCFPAIQARNLHTQTIFITTLLGFLAHAYFQLTLIS